MKLKFPFTPRVLIPFAAMVILLTIMAPRRGNFEYSYRKGAKWNYETLVAPFSFPILKTAEQLATERERLGSTYVPYYKYAYDVMPSIANDLRNLLSSNQVLAMRATLLLRDYYDRGVLPSSQSTIDSFADESREIVFIQKEKRAVKTPRSELYTDKQIKTLICSALSKEFPEINVDSILTQKGIYSLLTGNLVFDRQTTELVHVNSADYISPSCGVFNAGDIIVSSGEIITSDIAQIIDSYKAEFENNVGYLGPNYRLWIGNFGLALFFAAILFVLLLGIAPYILSNHGQLCFVILTFILCSIATFVFCRFPHNLVYLMPFPVFSLYLMAFFRKKVVIPLYAICIIPILIFCEGGPDLYFCYLVSGVAAIQSFGYFNKGWRQFITVLIIFFTLFCGNLFFKCFIGSERLFDFNAILYMFLGSLFCILAYPLTYLFEIIFNLVSASRLIDLTDANSRLLQELSQKAPGTFQHSIAVMNMAEYAARSIDADVFLVRAGAMYHDIGKTVNPDCFIENQTPGMDYHRELSPRESALEIIKHVTDGELLAEKYGIPRIIREFIRSHHGNSSVGYFYTKYLNEGGDPENASGFFYPGPKPKTKEQVILMLSDTLEAASRTLTDFSAESVKEFVHKIYADKYHSGQYDDADIKMSEIKTVVKALEEYIVRSHHSRIEYPKKKSNYIKK